MEVLKIKSAGTNYFDVTEYIVSGSYGVEFIQQSKNVRTNALGDTTFTLVHPKFKIYATFTGSDENIRAMIMQAIRPYYLTVQFWDTETQTTKEINCYPQTIKNVYITLNDDKTLLDAVEISFVEM